VPDSEMETLVAFPVSLSSRLAAGRLLVLVVVFSPVDSISFLSPFAEERSFEVDDAKAAVDVEEVPLAIELVGSVTSRSLAQFRSNSSSSSTHCKFEAGSQVFSLL